MEGLRTSLIHIELELFKMSWSAKDASSHSVIKHFQAVTGNLSKQIETILE
jgi:hypothetical protein